MLPAAGTGHIVNAMNESTPPRILIVDDDLRLRDLLCRHLCESELHAKGVADGRDMGAALSRDHYDLIVLDHPFMGEVETAPRYRFYSVRDEFPGLVPVADDGAAVRGELYDVPLEVLRDSFLPHEPAELELGAVELSDGRAALCMVLRPEQRDRHKDITEHGGWRAYRATLG